MPRFVILRHEMPPGRDRGLHFDLMLECGGALRTWSLPEMPMADKPIQAEALPDHRLAYLDYEGPVSRERGRVAQWDHGAVAWVADEGFLIRLRLSGERLVGELTLDREALSPLWSARFFPAVPA